MAKIVAKKLFDDVDDRIDNLVLTGAMPESVRQKVSKARMCMAITSAVRAFAQDAPVSALTYLIEDMGSLEKSGTDGIVDFYQWPEGVYTSREDHGIVGVIIGGQIRSLADSIMFSSLRAQVASPLHAHAKGIKFSLDAIGQRLFVAKGVKAGMRVVVFPEMVTTGNLDSHEIKIADSLFDVIAGLSAERIVASVMPGSGFRRGRGDRSDDRDRDERRER